MAFDALRLFLYRVLPWHPRGDPSAYVNIHWTFQGAGFDKPAWSGRACMSIDECVNTVAWAQRLPDTKDFYVCLSTQRQMLEQKTKSGRTQRKAVRSQQNAVQANALWIDVDVKDGHHKEGYDDLRTAAVASIKFFADAGIPRPTITVKTGSGGLHFYWCLNVALDIATWQPLAQALAEATRRFGLKCDTQCTVDIARVMRLPETKHSRSGQMAEMSIEHTLAHDYTLDQMRHALAPYMGAQVIPLNPRGKLTGANSDLAGGIETAKAPPINIDTVAAAGCGFIATALSTGGAAYANPLWNLTTLVATFSEGGRVDAHRMASGYPAYSQAETDDLFDRKLREREERNLGWPSCQSVENAGCTSCVSCPLKGQGTRPLQFGRPTQAPVQASPPIDADLPHRYCRDPVTGIISKIIVNPKTGSSDLIQLVPFPIRKGWMQSDPYTIHFEMEVAGEERRISLTTAEANVSEGFAKKMGEKGIPMNDDTRKELREFIVAWQTKLQQVKDAVITSAPFGWSEPRGKINGFAYGGRVWQDGTDKPAAQADHELAKQYTPRGDLQPWLDAAKMITDLKTPERDAYLGAAFGAPLVKLTGLRGLMFCTYSGKSGSFKSTAMAVALGVWGHPQAAQQMLDDTQNQILNKIGKLQALPIFWDELKTEQDTQRFVNTVFRMTQGKERGRLRSDTSMRESGMWQTLMMSASNMSVLDMVARQNKTTTAGIHRIFEYEVPKVDSERSMNSADQMIARLNNNFGQAGLVYAKFLGSNHEAVAKDVSDMREKLEKKLSIQKEERFWSTSIAVIYLGAKYANQLGLTQIDLARLLGFLLDVLKRMRAEVQSKPVDMANKLAVSNVVQQYLAEMGARHLIRTDRIHINRGKPKEGSVKLLNDASRIDGVRIQIGEESKLMRLAATPFRDWAHEKGYSAHMLISAMQKEFNIRETQGRLGSGTPFVSMIEYILEFDLTNPALKDLLEY